MKNADRLTRFRRRVQVFTIVSLIALSGGFLKASALTLTLWDSFEPRAALVREWAARYSAEVRPDVQIEIAVMDDLWDKLMVGILAGTPPDMVQFHNEMYGLFEGLLAPYPTDLFPHEKMADEFFMFEANFLIDGNMYYYPDGIMTAGLFYNKDLLAQAGIDRPAATWDGLVEEAKKLTRMVNEHRVQAGIEILQSAEYVTTDLIYQAGGTLFDDNLRAQFMSNAATQARDTLLRFHEADVSPLPGQALRFEGGLSAMRYEWTWFEGPLQNVRSVLNYGVVPLPTYTGDPLPAKGRNNYEAGIAVPHNVAEERKREAFDFIKWLYDQDDFYIALNLRLGRIPGKMELWNHPDLLAEETFQVLVEQAPYTVMPGAIPSWYFPLLRQAWGETLLEKEAPSNAFSKAQVLANVEWEREPAVFIVEAFYE